MIGAKELTFTQNIAADPADVGRAFTHPTLLRDWLCAAADVEGRAGGRLYLYWPGADGAGYAVCGTYSAVEPGRLAFSWQGSGDPGETQVRVEWTPRTAGDQQGEGAHGTLLRLTHSGLGEGAAWEALARRWSEDWTAALENLQSVLEGGVDLREARRPRLGIWMDEFSSEKAAALGVPVGQGVWLYGTAEGSGAEAAGLKKDDVLVRLNGVELRSPDSFAHALRGLQAGDSPQVEYYRGSELRSAALRLGSFPIPPLPESAAELAQQARAASAEMLRAITEQIGDLSGEQAARRPAGENEWNVLELVAHFILMERDFQSWMAQMLNDQPAGDDLEMRPNANPRIRALVARMPRLHAQAGQPGLLDELALALEESAVMIEALPESFTRGRKSLFRRVVGWALEIVPGHYSQEHREQFQQLIAR